MTNASVDLFCRPSGSAHVKYSAIADTIEAAIASGLIVPGQRLPTHRELARHLGTAVATISRAYSEAERRGLVEGQVGRGTVVTSSAATESISTSLQSPVIDLTIHWPPNEGAARHFSHALKTLARRRDVSDVLGHQPANGWLRHRAAAARWLCNRGMDTKVAEVVACNGVQHGISVIFSALLRPGDVVATEALNYPFVKLVADLHRAVLAPIPLDGEGMQPEALDRACRAGNVKFLLCTPTMHNPTGITMPPKRREALVRVAQRHDLLIIENDLLGGMATDPPPTIASLARNRTCYVTGLTKIAATGLRLGLVVAPEVLLARVTRAIHSTIWMPPPLLLEIFTMWVDEKILDAIVEWHRREAAARAQLAARIVGNRCPEFRQGGYNVWLRLPGSLTAHRFAKLVERKGCLVLPGDVFAIGDAVPPHPAIRVSLGGMNSRSRVEEGLRLITSVLDQTVGP